MREELRRLSRWTKVLSGPRDGVCVQATRRRRVKGGELVLVAVVMMEKDTWSY